MELSIVLPAWNEAGNLPPLIRELRAALEGVTSDYEIVVVDGGSRDGTAEVARELGCRVLVQTTPGYGGALREGFATAAGRYLCTLDADLSHPPTFITEMWRRRDEGDLVIASRYVPGGSADMPRTRAWLSIILNRGFSELLSIPAGDLSSGFRLYRREALERFTTTARNFNVLQELLTGILARGGKIIEVPFHYRPRVFGVSHARIIRFGISYIGTLRHLFFLRTALFRGDEARRLLPYFLLILLAVACAYTGALRDGALRWDDDYLVFENPALRSLEPASIRAMFDPGLRPVAREGEGGGPPGVALEAAPSRAQYGSQYEPLADLSYAVDGRIFGWSDPRPFHLQGVLWHALAACLLFVLVNRHTGQAGIALVAALVFAVHPVTTEAVTWISGRRTAMSAALVLASAVAWVRFRRTGGLGAYAGSLAALALACLCKQSGVAGPLVLLALDLTARERPRSPAALLLPLAPPALLAAASGALSYAIGVREGIVGPHPLGLEGQVGSALVALAYYARLAVAPFRVAIEPGALPHLELILRPIYADVFSSRASLVAAAGAGLAVLGAATAATLALRRRAPAASFGLAAAGATLLPALSGLGPHPVAERYLYLPLAFLAVAAGAGFAALARVGPPPSDLAEERALTSRRRRLSAALVVVLVALGAATHARNRDWRDDIALWSDAVAKDPWNRAAHQQLAEALLRLPAPISRGFPASFGGLARMPAPDAIDRAERELLLAADLLERGGGPTRGPSQLPAVLAEVANIHELRGDPDGAAAALARALADEPGSELAAVALGDLLARHGDRPRARALLRGFVAAHPEARLAAARLRALED